VSSRLASTLREIVNFEDLIVERLDALLSEIVSMSDLSEPEKENCKKTLLLLRNESAEHAEETRGLLETEERK